MKTFIQFIKESNVPLEDRICDYFLKNFHIDELYITFNFINPLLDICYKYKITDTTSKTLFRYNKKMATFLISYNLIITTIENEFNIDGVKSKNYVANCIERYFKLSNDIEYRSYIF